MWTGAMYLLALHWERMPPAIRTERGTLITISVAALFALLVMGAASAEVANHPSSYSFSRVSKLNGAKLVSARIASVPSRSAASRVQAVAESLRQGASDFDYALIAVCLLLQVSLVVFTWRISLPALIPIRVRHNGLHASRAPPVR